MKNKTLALNVALQMVIAGLLAIARPTALYVDVGVILMVSCVIYVIWTVRN